jgi:hypothetical protein
VLFSSAFSGLSRRTSADPSDVAPGRSPASTSARRTHCRTVSADVTRQLVDHGHVAHREHLRVTGQTEVRQDGDPAGTVRRSSRDVREKTCQGRRLSAIG